MAKITNEIKEPQGKNIAVYVPKQLLEDFDECVAAANRLGLSWNRNRQVRNAMSAYVADMKKILRNFKKAMEDENNEF